MIRQKAWGARQVESAILSYLSRDETLKEKQVRRPQSTRAIHRLLHENGRIASRLPTFTDPIERPPPMQHWQLDFKDASSVEARSARQKAPCGGNAHYHRQRHWRLLVAHHVRSDFTAETASFGSRTNFR